MSEALERCCDSKFNRFAMSKNNKVNKTNYDQAGRLTPDEIARERKVQSEVTGQAKQKDRIKGKAGARGASRPRSAPEE